MKQGKYIRGRGFPHFLQEEVTNLLQYFEEFADM